MTEKKLLLLKLFLKDLVKEYGVDLHERILTEIDYVLKVVEDDDEEKLNRAIWWFQEE